MTFHILFKLVLDFSPVEFNGMFETLGIPFEILRLIENKINKNIQHLNVRIELFNP